MSDIVARLRDWRNVHLARLHILMEEAADEMERLPGIGHCPEPDNVEDHDNLLAEVRRLRSAITALADQDATLSVCDGAVTVTMDATLTDDERAAVEWCVEMALNSATDCAAEVRTLRGLLERL